RSRRLIAWFGPRGLSTLLLALLPVFAGAEGAEPVFRVACLVVLLSVLLHGGALIWMGPAKAQAVPSPVAPLLTLVHTSAQPIAPASPFEVASAADEIRMEELRALLDVGAPVVLADVRRATDWEHSDQIAAGAVRLAPDRPVEDARRLGLPTDAWIVL